MNKKTGIVLLIAGSAVAIATALAHLSCLYFGPEFYAAQMAPPAIVESAQQGTWLAPVGNIFVSSLFLLMAAYALSGAGIFAKLPLLKPAMYTIAVLCIIRGVLPIQLWLRKPDRVTDEVLIVGLVWLLTGFLYLFGFRIVRKSQVHPLT